jgi:hypothetical protein
MLREIVVVVGHVEGILKLSQSRSVLGLSSLLLCLGC